MDQTAIDKPELVVFSQNAIGGVQSYYYNLLMNDAGNQFDKVWILTDDYFNNNPRPLKSYDTGFEKVFYYRSDTPQFNYLKELEQFVSNKPGVVLASFPLELMVMHVYRKKNKVIGFVCHDEYFVQFAKQYDFLIDFFIVHNPVFYTRLKELLPPRSNDIYYLPYGIKLPKESNTLNLIRPLRIIVIARMQNTKGVLDIPLIAEGLKQRGIPFELTIVGDGPEKDKVRKLLNHFPEVNFQVPPTFSELIALIKNHDIFLLPSYLDGMPVSLMETMSCGLVPILSDFNEGIKQIITSDKGFVLPKGDINAFVLAIGKLHEDRSLLESYRKASLAYAIEQFDAEIRAKEYYQLFTQFHRLRKKTRFKYISYGPLINHPKVPEWLRKNYYRAITLKKQLWR
ncbi:MAG: glycosyltransferase family 4 protein [Sphingobacteriales bacterium]|nr:glycosyltransferase family 4 protein [Sphingobacteriales bacterium]MBI3718042.1 glycosyltransferase family 4 protein [Sphingobacteriales bacterium]